MTNPVTTRRLGRGQVALELETSPSTPRDQLRDLARISDPALSELEFDPLLEELLIRVRDLLGVDTAAFLLLDREANELVARAAKGIEEEVKAGVRIPVGVGFAGRIARERVAIYIADVDHADVLNPILREKGIRSLLGVPLIVEGELIGVMHVGSLTPRVFDLRDLGVLELAAARAAPAIERARLVGELAREHRNAMMLQRSLLPRRLGSVPGISVAARYVPARDEVGGDWYDVIQLTRGRVGVVIGDVVGHGLNSAILMGQLRTALHSYALVEDSPGRVLELVDRFASSLDPEVMATVAYALVDGESGKIQYASAGHLPPVILSATGAARAVEVEIAPPIGAFAYKHSPEHELALVPGETMILYTDGLIERPRVPLTQGIEELVEAVNGSRSPEEACLLAMDRLVPHQGPRDDVAVIAVKSDPVPAVLELTLDAHPTVLMTVRQMLARWLRAQGLDREVQAEVTIATSEASANAIEHAYGPGRGRFTVRVERTGDVIEVTVTDQGSWRAPRGEQRGRGLKIMRAAMDEVEIGSADAGTRIVMRRELRSS